MQSGGRWGPAGPFLRVVPLSTALRRYSHWLIHHDKSTMRLFLDLIGKKELTKAPGVIRTSDQNKL